MLWKRYANPLELLKTYSLEATADFLFYLMDKDKEELLWDMWVHTSMEKSFKEFKKMQNVQSLRKKQKTSIVTDEQEKELLKFASQFVNINQQKKEDD
ncbi:MULTISPECIES: peptide methionine sulfoxide reductase [Vagococcus]|uniref:peptide methionine sulfoxide reductase n=1 Tax=Vagococcus TaxID=2737 RepID=UPI0011C3C9B0|nr:MULTISPECIES: peptide methionine sulfoxide reductase [Vagococcus]